MVWLSASLSLPDIWIWMLVLLLPARKSKSSNGLKTYYKFSRYLSGGTYFCNFSLGKSWEGRNLSCRNEYPPQAMDFQVKVGDFLAHFPLFLYSFNLYVYPLSPSFLGPMHFCSIHPCLSEEPFVLSFGMSDGPWEGSGRGQIGVGT